MSPRNEVFGKPTGWLLLCVVLILGTPPFPALAQPPEKPVREERSHSAFAVMQGFVSKADGPRCPMSPTCSHYASEAFRQHGAVVGWVLTCDRLLRCGRDETRLAPSIRTPDGPRVQDPLSANIFWWKKPR